MSSISEGDGEGSAEAVLSEGGSKDAVWGMKPRRGRDVEGAELVRDGSNLASRDGTAVLGGDAGVVIDGGRVTSTEGLLSVVDRVEFSLRKEVSYSVAFSTAVVARSVRTRT